MKKLYEEPKLEITQFYVEEKIMNITPGEVTPYVGEVDASGPGWNSLDEDN